MISTEDLSPAELAALLHFHAEAGVEWLIEDEPVDRFAEFAAQRRARSQARPAAQALAASQRQDEAAGQAPQPPAPQGAVSAQAAQSLPSAPVSRPQPAIPDADAVAQARFAAESAGSLAELRQALDGFGLCNLRHSARSTVFAAGSGESGVMVIGPAPAAEDDREGLPFSGRHGLLLDRMLGAIGLTRERVLMTHVIPWRPPGSRPPSPAETELCRPFIERQIALAKPRAVLLFGHFTGRFFFGDGETIHAMRGRLREIAAGPATVPAMATLHPQELLTAPVNKRLVWQDLLAFRAALDATDGKALHSI